MHVGLQAVEEDVKDADEYDNEDVGDVVLPLLDRDAIVVKEVHLHQQLRHDIADGGLVEDPAEEVDAAGEEADDAAVARAGGHGGSMVDAGGGRDR